MFKIFDNKGILPCVKYNDLNQGFLRLKRSFSFMFSTE